jgi:Na+/melibiose symporter-like transporter
MSLIAILFPWLILLLKDNPGGAVVALVMQASIIGWPFAAVWALRIQRETRKAQAEEKRQAKEEAKQAKEQAKKKPE